MEKINENYMGDAEGEVLSIFCFDSVEVKARITFESGIVEGVRMTYWMEDIEDRGRVVDDIFDLLFEDVVRVRGVSSVKTIEKN